MRSTRPDGRPRRWLEDGRLWRWLGGERVTALCLARPANAMVAVVTGRPLAAGVVWRWPTTSSYRLAELAGVDTVLRAIHQDAAKNLVVCGVDGDGHVVLGPFWCSRIVDLIGRQSEPVIVLKMGCWLGLR